MLKELGALYDKEIEKHKESVKRAREETKEVQAKLEILQNAYKTPESAWELLCKAEGSEELVRQKRIVCQWAKGGIFCQKLAEEALPRPAIFVCPEHKTYWTERVEENKRARFVGYLRFT